MGTYDDEFNCAAQTFVPDCGATLSCEANTKTIYSEGSLVRFLMPLHRRARKWGSL